MRPVTVNHLQSAPRVRSSNMASLYRSLTLSLLTVVQAAFLASTPLWNEAKGWKNAEIKVVRQLVKTLPMAQQSMSELLQAC